MPLCALAFLLACSSKPPNSSEGGQGHIVSLTDEAKLAAIWISDEPIYPEDLTLDLQEKLAELRDKYGEEIPEVNINFIYSAVPKQLRVTFYPEVMGEVIYGEYDNWDELNEKYRVSDIIIEEKFNWAKLVFEDQINPYFLSDLYAGLEGVRYANANGYGGDYPNIYPWIVDGKIAILVRDGWGDCPSGCIYNHFWYFKSGSNSISLIGEFEMDEVWWENPVFPSWWIEIEPAYCKYKTGEAGNCGIYGG